MITNHILRNAAVIPAGDENIMNAGIEIAENGEWGGEFEHAAGKLEFRTLLEMVAAASRSERSREIILSTTKTGSTAGIERSQREIAELAQLREGGEDIPLDGWRDSWPVLHRIRAEGAVANGEELACIADGERTARSVFRVLGTWGEKAPLLFECRSRLGIQEAIIDRISRTIGPDHEVLDRASADLARIRREIGSMRNRLRKAFSEFVARRGSGKGYEFVTVRGERYVVSLPRGDASRVKGIVHHESGSGASVYIEPLEFVEDNNRIEYLVQEERREVERILGELTADVFVKRRELKQNQDVLCTLDVIASKTSFSRRFRCRKPAHSTDGTLIFRDARHPILEKRFIDAGEGGNLVPLNLSCKPEVRTIVISGPNAGGKTVALKTVGLLVMMDMSGLLLPAGEGTVIPDYGTVFVDIGDDQSIEKSLSTFSSRIVRMKKILQAVNRKSLVLVDEIGDGTDPDEGAALAKVMLERLTERAGRTIVTTHLSRLKGWAHESAGAANATLEFDPEELEPLFTMRMGVPGRSWGIEMAWRLGLPEDIIEEARWGMGEHALRLEELLAHLEHTEHAVERKRRELIEKERLLTELISSYRDRLDNITRSRGEMEQEARKEALEIVSSTRREMERLIREIRTSQARREVIRESKEALGRTKEHIEKKLEKKAKEPYFKPEDLVEGMRVEIESLDRTGKIMAVKGASRIMLELGGGLRVETSIEDLAPPRGEVRPDAGVNVTWTADSSESVSTELMVRGMERTEALEKVDYFIDRAVLQGLRQVVIIHGVGRGVLKRAIYDMLKKDPRVRDVRPGEPALGGDGVAVVDLE